MRAVVQRVSRARVSTLESELASIGRGLVVLLGVGFGDTTRDAIFLAEKVANLRIFDDGTGRMNLSCLDIGGEVLVVSQFTLLGDCLKGRRPDFTRAARPEPAEAIYDDFVRAARNTGLRVETGRFRALMDVELVNQGPVTLLVESGEDVVRA